MRSYALLVAGCAGLICVAGFLFGFFSAPLASAEIGGAWGLGLAVFGWGLVRLGRCGRSAVALAVWAALSVGVLGVGHMVFYVFDVDDVAERIRRGEIGEFPAATKALPDETLFREYARLELGENAEGGLIDHLRLFARGGTHARERVGWPRGAYREAEQGGRTVWAGWFGQAMLIAILPALGIFAGSMQVVEAEARRRTNRGPPPKASLRLPETRAVVPIRRFDPPVILHALVAQWWRFALPGLVTLVGLWLAPNPGWDATVWLLVSGLYVGAAADALAEDPREREIINLNRLAAHLGDLVLLGAPAFLVLFFIFAIPGYLVTEGLWMGAAISLLAIAAVVLGLAARIWPYYVVPWLYRTRDESDVWWRRWHNFFPLDWKLAWRLAVVPGALRGATLPALGVSVGALLAWGALYLPNQQNAGVAWVLHLFLLFVLWPLLIVIVVDRAKALRDGYEASLGDSAGTPEAARGTAQPSAPRDDFSDDARESPASPEQVLDTPAERAPEAAPSATELPDATRPTQPEYFPPESPPRGRERRIDPSEDWMERKVLERTRGDPDSLLGYAVKYRRADWARQALQAGASPTGEVDGKNYLVELLAGPDGGVLDVLLNAGADINAADRRGQTPLHFAVSYNTVTKAERLLSAGADPRLGDQYGRTPLHAAATSLAEACIEPLCGAGADTEQRDQHGKTALMLAAGNRRGALTVAALVRAGADVNTLDAEGHGPLWYAARFGEGVDNARLLVEAGADPHARDGRKRTVLMAAVEANRPEPVEYLLRIGVDPRATDDEDRDARWFVDFDRPNARVKELIEDACRRG